MLSHEGGDEFALSPNARVEERVVSHRLHNVVFVIYDSRRDRMWNDNKSYRTLEGIASSFFNSENLILNVLIHLVFPFLSLFLISVLRNVT